MFDVFFGVLIVIIFLLVALGPVLRRLFGPMIRQWMMGLMEDRMRRMAGMPTRKEERKARRNAGRRRKSGAEAFRRAAGGRRSGDRAAYGGQSAVDMMQNVAEDVEFTEIKEYSQTQEIASAPRSGEYKAESQVEDADFVEIK